MDKELVIIFIIIVFIIAIDSMANHYTLSSIQTMSSQLEELKINFLEKKEEEIKKQIEQIDEQWKQYHKVLACYIEHDELEKIETQLANLKGKLEVKEYEESMENIDTMVFFLEHIEDKEKFSIESIF